MRKSPKRHHVRKHTRLRRPVHDYWRGHGNPRLIVRKRKISKHIPKTVVLWHGSPVENKDLILRHGIQYRRPQVEKMIDKAVKEIQKEVGIEDFKTDGFVRSRVMESTEKGGIVFLSGDREFAISNALAGKEWYRTLLSSALHKKLKGMYSHRQRLAHKQLQLLKELDKFKQKKSFALGRGDYEEYHRVRHEEKKIEEEYNKAHEKYSSYNKKLLKTQEKYHNKLITRKAVLFRIEVPWHEFKKLAGDDWTKHQINRYEELVKKGFEKERIKRLQAVGAKKIQPMFEWYFQEVHMDYIPPKYIKAYGFFEQHKPFKLPKQIKPVMHKVR